MCDATSVSILHQYLNDYILGVPSCSGMQLEFLDRCVNEDERLALVQSRQLQYWERLLSSSKDESNRSEEHTSELQSLMRTSYAVFCLKKKKTNQNTPIKNRKDTVASQETNTEKRTEE